MLSMHEFLLTDSEEAQSDDDVPALIQISQRLLEDVALVKVGDDVVGDVVLEPILYMNQISGDTPVQQRLARVKKNNKKTPDKYIVTQ